MPHFRINHAVRGSVVKRIGRADTRGRVRTGRRVAKKPVCGHSRGSGNVD
jgi:hypothetical protein